MPVLESLGTAVPAHRVEQDALRDVALAVVRDRVPELARLADVFTNARIDARHFAMPLEWYLEPHDWEERSRAFVDVGVHLAEDAARRALDAAGLAPADVDGVLFVTTTGIATPSLDARLANRLGFRADVTRVPVWGLGCAGGVAGLARGMDFVNAHPGKRVLVIALELCSLQFLLDRVSKKALVAASLFSDGCGAAVIAGDAVPGVASGPRLTASASHLFPGTERVMGWDVRANGLDVVISPEIPRIVDREVAGLVNAFLKTHAGGAPPQHWLLHPGGAKVVDAYKDALALPNGALHATEGVLRAFGNMSSPTVLFVAERALGARPHLPRGERALLGALGPGFASELLLVEGA